MRNVFLAPLSPEKNNLKKYKYFVCPIPVFLWTIRQLSQYDKNSVILKITNDKVLLFSFLVMSNSLQSHELQHTSLPCPSLSPGVCSNWCPLSQWCHPAISSSVASSLPALGLSQHQGLFKWVSSSHEMAKVLEFQLQHQSFQWTPRTDLF